MMTVTDFSLMAAVIRLKAEITYAVGLIPKRNQSPCRLPT